MNTLYKHTQAGYVILFSCAGGACVLLALSIAMRGTAVASAGNFFGIFVLLACAALFSSLTISIENGWLIWKFGPGLIRKKVPLELIRDARVVRNNWLGGWGIHYVGNGWLYNVSGMRSVQVFLKNGKQFRLGSDEPEALVEAIKTATQNASKT